jgi:amino acid adenylation domain-containing protein
MGEYVLPASLAQRRMWVLHQLDPTSAAYNLPLALWIEGALDRERLAAALDRIAGRHETLRTRFTVEDGEPVQLVAEAAMVSLASEHAPDEPAALRRARAFAHEPLDLAAGPLWRVLLVTVAGGRHLLLLCLHHAICDGWSIGVLAGELERFYRDPRAALPELSVQYGDFAAWQAAQLAGPAGTALVERCRDRLDGAPDRIDLPVDRPRVATRLGRGLSVEFAIDDQAKTALAALALSSGATEMMAHAAIFGAVLGRWCNTTQLVLGVPVAGRSRTEFEGMIGLFVNTVLLPVDLRADPALAVLLDRVRRAMLGALDDQAVPFERLVEAFQPERNLGQNPLFQVLFTYQNLPPARLELPGLRLEPAELGGVAPQFDLTASLAEEDGRLIARLVYDADLFEPATIEAFARQWRLLAASAASASGRAITLLPLAGAAEIARLVELSGPEPTPVDGLCVHQAILARACREPGRIFLEGDDGALDGAALADAIREVAGRLAAMGVGRGDRVGVYLRRGTRLVPALLGVLAAGAAYIPLDPIYPPDRVKTMLAEGGAGIVVTERALAGDLEGLRLVVLGEPGGTAAVAAAPNLDDLAYVIFTSGSTGTPKGVQIGHRALANLLEAAEGCFGCGAGDVWMATTTISFDIAALELYLPLLSGARLVIAGAETTADGSALAAALDRHRATIMQATPSGWQVLLGSGWSGRLKALCGGEALAGDLADALIERTGEAWNLYGPTETTIWSAMTPVAAGGGGTAAIAGTIANTKIYVTDSAGQLIAGSGIGEICIAGAGVAWGYIHRPDLTAERFVADPYGAPGSRLYRTGDLGRRRGDGTIEFLGRADHQVKLRGYRIELGEIEAALRAEGADAVVGLRGAGDHARLVAWVRTAAAIDGAALGRALARRLPAYMVPAGFVAVATWPMTANGKLDRKSLPDSQGLAVAATVAPRNPDERDMLALWHSVLGREDFGVEDDFFALGGHSLLATRLTATIRERTGVVLGLRELFLRPTVAALTDLLTGSGGGAEPGSPLVPLAAGGDAAPLVIVPGAGGNPLYLRNLARALGSDRPIFGFEAIGSDGRSEPIAEVEAIAARYLTEARVSGLGAPWLFAGHSFGSHVAYEMAIQAEADGDAVAGLIVLDTAAPVLDSNPFAAIAEDEDAVIAEVAGALEIALTGEQRTDLAALAEIPRARRFDWIAERLRGAGWVSGTDAARGLCNVYRAARRCHYRAGRRIDAPLLLVKAETALATPGTPMPAPLAALVGERLWGWDRLVDRGRITLATAAGDHITMVSTRFAPGLARAVREWLAACPGDETRLPEARRQCG